MWYHPGTFALGWRDVAAAWIVCFAVAAGLFGYCVFEREGAVELRSAAVRSAIGSESGSAPVAGNRAAARSS